MSNRYILIDGNSLMFRAYYATAFTGNLMKSKNGIYTNALFSFINMMNKIEQTYEYTHMLVAFDTSHKTFRHIEYTEYKGTRKPLEEELAMQIPLIKDYLDVKGIKRLEQAGLEADDILAIYAKKAEKTNADVIVISGDRDLLQLVDEKTEVHLTKKGITEIEAYTINNFKEKMGFRPNQMVDYKALIGDSSDNLPGIRGVGPKTAVTLLNKYDNLDNIFEHIADEKGKLQESLRLDEEVSKKTRYLATLLFEAEVPYTLDDLLMKEEDLFHLRSFYEKYDLNFFIDRLDTKSVTSKQKIELPNKQHIDEIEQTVLLLNQNCYLELELTGDNYHRSDILGISFYFNDELHFVSKNNLFDDRFKTYLENPSFEKKTYDSKKVICSLAKIGIDIQQITFDFTLANYLLNPDSSNSDYRTMLDLYITNNLDILSDIYGKKAEYLIPMDDVYIKYSFQKIYFLSLVEEKMLQALKDSGMNELYYQMELPLAKVLAQMELSGCAIDHTQLMMMGETFAQTIKEVTTQIYEYANREFNIGSPKQLGQILFDELNLGHGKKNKTGYSTAAEVLESMIDDHPIIPLILEYRKYTKLLNTYVTGLSADIFPDGKVHTIFKQTLTSTGRLSSVSPNIQNIPVRKEEGRLIRTAFIPSLPKGIIVSADYSQIELRLLAEMANCQAMIRDFNAGLDMHRSTAAKVYNVSYEEVTKEMRSQSKAINFGIVYGMSDWGLAETLKISPYEASKFIEKYFAIYPEIKTYLNEMVETAKVKGYSETLFHRRRSMKDINSNNQTLRKFQERTAMNAPIQGTAADVMKLAMIKIDQMLKEQHLVSKMIAQVHDEIIMDCDKNEESKVKELLKEAMEHAVTLRVKLTVEVSSGLNWNLK